MTSIYLRSAGFCLLLLYLGVTGYHSFNVSEQTREDDWSLDRGAQ